MNKFGLRIKEFYAFTLLLLSWLFAKFLPGKKDLWLFCERGTDARDNGYWMFLYMKENHPEVKSKYIITKTSEDRPNLLAWKQDLVTTGSFSHYLLLYKAKLCVSTHRCGCYPEMIHQIPFFRSIISRLTQTKNVFLQHGVTKDDIKGLHYGKSCIDYFVCGAKPEYDYISRVYEYPQGYVRYPGFARFDNLHSCNLKKRQILVMPTWRAYITDTSDFKTTEFFRAFSSFLQNVKIRQLFKSHDLTLIFYPHYEIQKHIQDFKALDLPENIIIADKAHYDVQQLLKESALLVTDYSSVFFDFAYMRKPVLFYQFDEKEYRSKHYSEGYYDYRNGLGKWTDKEDVIIDYILESVALNFKNPPLYEERIDDFFPLYDTCNRERIYRDIIDLFC